MLFLIMTEGVGMQRGHTLTGHPSTLTPRRKLWTGVAIYLREKGLNSFLTAQMARFKIPTAMVQIHVHPRTQSINHLSSQRRQQVARTACCFFSHRGHTLQAAHHFTPRKHCIVTKQLTIQSILSETFLKFRFQFVLDYRDEVRHIHHQSFSIAITAFSLMTSLTDDGLKFRIREMPRTDTLILHDLSALPLCPSNCLIRDILSIAKDKKP